MAGYSEICATANYALEGSRQQLKPENPAKPDSIAKPEDLAQTAVDIAKQGQPADNITKDAVKAVTSPPDIDKLQKISTGEQAVLGDTDPGEVLNVDA